MSWPESVSFEVVDYTAQRLAICFRVRPERIEQLPDGAGFSDLVSLKAQAWLARQVAERFPSSVIGPPKAQRDSFLRPEYVGSRKRKRLRLAIFWLAFNDVAPEHREQCAAWLTGEWPTRTVRCLNYKPLTLGVPEDVR